MPDRINKEHARVAALSRHRSNPSDPALTEARGKLAAAKLEAYVEQVVAAAPPLTPEQAERIAALLRPSARGSAA